MPKRDTLPERFHAEQHYLRTVPPGIHVWTVPWAMQVDTDGHGYLHPIYSWFHEPHGTACMEVWWTAEGWHVALGQCGWYQWEHERLTDDVVRNWLPVQRIHTEDR